MFSNSHKVALSAVFAAAITGLLSAAPPAFGKSTLGGLESLKSVLEGAQAVGSVVQQSSPQLPSSDKGFAGCLHHFPSGSIPRVAGQLARQLCFDGFAVLHSGVTRTPTYAIAHLTPDSLRAAKQVKRRDAFFADARLPRAERAELGDYSGSGFDRGHMFPAASAPNETSLAQSFSLANMVPQAPVNNRKVWSKIESDTRKYALRSAQGVFVISGPAYVGTPIQKVGRNNVWVPTHLFKIVYDPSKQRAWVHWIENRDEARARKPLRYSEFRQMTGIDWFPGLYVGD